MEMKIGIANVAREVVIEPELTALEVEQAVTEAVSGGALRSRMPAWARVVIVPAAVIGWRRHR